MRRRRSRAVHFRAAVLGLLLPAAASAQSLPAGTAVKTLETHQALIDHRREEAGALYSQEGSAEVTLRRALQAANVSAKTIENYAHDWAGLGIGSDHMWARKNFYDGHAAAVAESISHVNARGVVSAAEMAQVDDGMTRWKAYEPGLRRLFEERVGLFVESAKLADMSDSAHAMECKREPTCELVKKGILAAADAASAEIGRSLGQNRDAITTASEVRFFSAIKGAAPAPACDTLALSYDPSAIVFGKTAYPRLTFGPEGCRPDAYPTFKLVSSPGAKFELNSSTGTVIKRDNQVGIAIIEAETEMLAPARARIDGDAAPACTALEWTAAPSSIHLGVYRYFALAFKPDGCFSGDMKIAVSADKPDVLRVSKSVQTGGEIFGKAVGTATLSASAGTLRAPAKTVDVLNDGEACKSLILAYTPDFLRVGTRRVQTGAGGTVPEVQYLPDSCKIPEGSVSFRVNPQDGHVVKLDTATGGLEGLSAGSALIVAQRGDVLGEATVRVEERPKCDLLVVRYDPNPIPVGGKASPLIDYLNLDKRNFDDPDARMCEQPKVRLVYSSSDPSRLPVDEYGAVTAKASGGALITVKPATEKPGDPSDVVEVTATQ